MIVKHVLRALHLGNVIGLMPGHRAMIRDTRFPVGGKPGRPWPIFSQPVIVTDQAGPAGRLPFAPYDGSTD